MMKWCFGVVALLGLGVSASEAQYYQRPVTNPYIRPGTAQNFNPYFGGNYGNSLLGTPGGLPGTTLGTGPGFGVGGSGIGLIVPDPTGALVVGTGGVLDPMAGNITGHATRFNSYSQYFNNQGGSLSVTTQSGLPSQRNTGTGTDQRRSITVGSRPLRGQGNTTQP